MALQLDPTCSLPDIADAQETGPQQGAIPAAPGNRPQTGVAGGRPADKPQEDDAPGCCGGCVIL
jgi:hypothetical protein